MAHILYILLFSNLHPTMCPYSLILKLKEERDDEFLWYYFASLNESVIGAEIGLWPRFLQLWGFSF